ncbi:MAG: hypothetical protein QXO22_04335 [Thermosphaera sp.]
MRKGVGMLMTVIVLFIASFAATVHAQLTTEFSLCRVAVAPSLAGSALVHFIPFNSSRVPSERGVYVLSDIPSYYHVISTYPPVVLVFEPAAPPETVYRVYVSSENPYSSYSVPYSSGVFAAYDDFDYPSSMWITVNTTVAGGKAALKNGWVVLNASIPDQVAAMAVFTGGRGLRIALPSNGTFVFTITENNFTDWSFIRDWNTVYFLNSLGMPVLYGIPYLSLEERVMIAVVTTDTPIIFMIYGGMNMYTEYRVYGDPQ